MFDSMPTASSNPTRPALRYHGGKWMIGKWIISHFPTHRVYVEPYGGGGSVLLRKPPCYAEVYNDLDGQIVNLFRVLQDVERSMRLEYLVLNTPYSRAEFELAYEPSEDLVEAARRTLIRSFMGFGSVGACGRKTGFRCDITRSGSTPAIDWVRFPKQIDLFAKRLRGVVLENRPALDVIKRFDTEKTLIYCDPPYPMSTRTPTAKWDRIYRFEMSDEDHTAMAEALKSVKSMVVISGYPCDLYDKELFASWHRVDRPHYASGGSKRTEVLWINERAKTALEDQNLGEN
jgi:DNA adenine methylase